MESINCMPRSKVVSLFDVISSMPVGAVTLAQAAVPVPANTRVRLVGLAYPECVLGLNDSEGFVRSYNPANRSYSVHLTSLSYHNSEMINHSIDAALNSTVHVKAACLVLPPDATFPLNCHVRIVGLRSNPQLNGTEGYVRSYDEASQRYAVHSAGQRVTMVKRVNLVPVVSIDSAEVVAAAAAPAVAPTTSSAASEVDLSVCACISCPLRRCANVSCDVVDDAAGDTQLSACGSCKAVAYCSPECQKKHWKAHKGECRAVAAAADSTKLEIEFFPCSRCVKVAYCSTTCQRVHWKAGHKHECRSASEAPAAAATAK